MHVLQKNKCFAPILLSIHFQCYSEIVDPPIRPEYSWITARWTLINNQSINLPPDITCTLALVKDGIPMVSFYRFSPKLYWQLLYDFAELLLRRTLIHMILIYPLRNDPSVCLITVSLSHYNISRKGPRNSEWHINCYASFPGTVGVPSIIRRKDASSFYLLHERCRYLFIVESYCVNRKCTCTCIQLSSRLVCD